MQFSFYRFAILRTIIFSLAILMPFQLSISSKIINGNLAYGVTNLSEQGTKDKGIIPLSPPLSKGDSGGFSDETKQPKKFSKSRILIIAPHPDDETLGCAMVISETIRQGNPVKIVLITNGDLLFRPKGNTVYDYDKDGDIDFVDYGYIRQHETLTAMGKLGLKLKDIIFLGYPDGLLWGIYNCDYNDIYLKEGFNFTMVLHTKSGYSSPYKNSYHYKIYLGEKPLYNRNYIISDLKKILSDFRPTDIFVTHEFDFHSDHKASLLFLRKAVKELKREGNPDVDHIKIHRYLIHYDLPEKAREEEEYPDPQSPELAVRDFTDNCKKIPWEETTLGAGPNGTISLDEDFKTVKHGLINCYATQLYDDYFQSSCKEEIKHSWLHQFVKDKEEWWDWPIDYPIPFDYYDKGNLWFKFKHWIKCFYTVGKFKIKEIGSFCVLSFNYWNFFAAGRLINQKLLVDIRDEPCGCPQRAETSSAPTDWL